MKTIIVLYANDTYSTTNEKKPMYLQKVCFKPMIEYCLETANTYSSERPYILTEDAAVVEKYGNNANIVKDFTQVADLEDADYLVVINAASPLINEEVIDHTISSMTLQNVDGAYAGEGLIIANKNLFHKVENLISEDFDEELAIGYCEEYSNETMVCSDRIDIAYADRLMRLNINFALMDQGVTIIDPESTYIEKGVIIGEDTIIYPGSFIEGNTTIGSNCEIYAGCNIKNAIIGNGVTVKNSTILDSSIDDSTTVGPYAYIRPNSVVGKNVKVGDFVELKKANIGDGTKISHLTYVGDANVGKNVNFGCGTVVVNYDGKNKYLTEIGDNVFVGCNTNLVSPVKVGDDAFIAAGSTITDDVPNGGFAIARQRQVNKSGWVKPKDRNK